MVKRQRQKEEHREERLAPKDKFSAGFAVI